MKTLEMITEGRMQVPMTVSWYLSDIGLVPRVGMKVLGRLKGAKVECLGRSQSAKWIQMN